MDENPSAQRFECDWNGVIIGRDLVWRGDRFAARREFNKDPDFRNRKTVDDATFDPLVRHVYKVLLTRGMVGTLMVSEGGVTREMLHWLTGGRGAALSRAAPGVGAAM